MTIRADRLHDAKLNAVGSLIESVLVDAKLCDWTARSAPHPMSFADLVLDTLRSALDAESFAMIVDEVARYATAGPGGPAATERRCEAPSLATVPDKLSSVGEPYDVEPVATMIAIRADETLAQCVGCDEIKPCRPRIDGRAWQFCSDECVNDFLERIELIVVRIGDS